MVWLEGRLNPKEYISRGPEVWCIFKWVSPPFIWRGWKTWKTIFLRISCSYDSGYKLGFAKSCTWFERWKWGSGLLPVIFGITLERSYPQWCLFVLWLPEAASVGGGCCSLGTLSIAQISLVQYLLLLLLLQACGSKHFLLRWFLVLPHALLVLLNLPIPLPQMSSLSSLQLLSRGTICFLIGVGQRKEVDWGGIWGAFQAEGPEMWHEWFKGTRSFWGIKKK